MTNSSLSPQPRLEALTRRADAGIRSCAVLFIVAIVAFGGTASCVDNDGVETEQTTQLLVNGPPLIITTSINAPIAGGRYQLIQGKSYTATVVVDAGTINRSIRLKANDSASTSNTASMIGNQSRYEIVKAYTGKYYYEFPLAASTIGSYQVGFMLCDGSFKTLPVYQRDAGVPVTVSSTLVAPRIATTTINAPMLNGRYVLYATQTYQVTVRVAMSNVTYSARVEPYVAPGFLRLSPSMSPPSDLPASTMPRYQPDQLYVFTVNPFLASSGTEGQIAFQLRDAVTGNPFGADAGILFTVRQPDHPRIVSTTIEGVTPNAGQYVLTIGQQYDVVVQVAPGTVSSSASAEIQYPVEASANLHNKISGGAQFAPLGPSSSFRFTMTPTSVGEYPIAFQIRDAPSGTGDAFNLDAGIQIVAAAPDAPHVGDIYGNITPAVGGSLSNPQDIRVQIDNGTPIPLNNGAYYFSSVPPGTHRLFVYSLSSPANYSPTTVINVPTPAAGIRVDVQLEEPFGLLRLAGMPYQRIIDYSRGRTVFHVVRLNKNLNRVEILPSNSGPHLETSQQIATRLASYGDPDPLVVINGGYFEYGTYFALGYAYYNQFTTVHEYLIPNPDDMNPVSGPTLGVTGTSAGQICQIAEKSFAFNTPDWHYIGNDPAWDNDQNNVPDVNYALQTEAFLVRPPINGTCWDNPKTWWLDMVPDINNTCVIDSPPDPMNLQNQYWARTAVGVDTNGNLVLVVADGESRTGRQGANYAQLAQLFVRELGVNYAMPLDSGGSTQMSIYNDAHAYRQVNALTGENNATPDGQVLNFVVAWPN